MSTVIRPRATFGTTQKNTPGVLGRSQTMYSSISNNIAMFASLPVTMQAFLALITAFAVAQQATTGTKAKGTASTRNSKRNAVWSAMLSLQSYVQGLADSMSVTDATTLIENAGMIVAKAADRLKAALGATLTTTPGMVHLAANRTALVGKANAHKRVLFSWEMSANGGQTWTALPPTLFASTIVSGLTLMSTYAFRVSVQVGNTPGTWSQAVSVLVH
jgi:hypothetical protein